MTWSSEIAIFKTGDGLQEFGDLLWGPLRQESTIFRFNESSKIIIYKIYLFL